MGKSKDNISDIFAYAKKQSSAHDKMMESMLSSREFSSDDYVNLAAEAENEHEARFYIKKALELDKSNIEASMMQIMMDGEGFLEVECEVKRLIKKEEARLKRRNCFLECEGHFWGVFETRTYMRLMLEHMSMIRDEGKLRLAALECEDMLRLCVNDNLGVRHIALTIYATLEDEQAALRVYDRYKEDSGAHMLLPLILLYYKLGNDRKAESFLKKLHKNNSEIDVFLDEWTDTTGLDMVKIHNSMDELSVYEVGTVYEIAAAVLMDLRLYVSTPSFFDWMELKFLKLFV